MLNYYGNHREESDIRRNNFKQWECMEKDVMRKLMSAIVALGVLDAEGRDKLISRIENLENGGGIERQVRREFKMVT